MLEVIEDMLSVQEVESFKKNLLSLDWQDGRNTAKGAAALVKHNEQANLQSPITQQLSQSLLQKFYSHPAFVTSALPLKIYPPRFCRYLNGHSYGFHVDSAVISIPNTQSVLRSDLSMTLFLNNPDEYDGGELVVTTEFGEQSVKLKAGSAVVYPSSSLHQVTNVTSGQRLVAICWIQSMVADEFLRNNLSQLDKVIQELTYGDRVTKVALQKLHNVYHNFLRKTAQL